MSAADLAFVNGKIYPTPYSSPVEALRLHQDSVFSLGAASDVLADGPGPLEVVDLRGKTVLPGLTDSHNHMMTYGLLKTQLDCGVPGAETLDGLRSALIGYASRRSPVAWVRGFGLDESRYRGQGRLDRFALDEVVSDRPVILTRTCTHGALLNSCGLASLGLRADSEDPRNGRIGRTESGEPDGWLYEAALETALARIDSMEGSDVEAALEVAQSDYLALGLTGVHDPGTDMIPSRDCVEGYRAFEESGRMKIRTYLMVRPMPGAEPREWVDEVAGLRSREGAKGALLRFGAVKLFADGSIGARTASLSSPYEDGPDNAGILKDFGEIRDLTLKAHLADLQVAIHAIGDRAVERTIDMFREILGKFPRSDHRHRIEHCELGDSALADRMKRLGLLATFQPGFVTDFGDEYVRALGTDRAERLIACRDFCLAGLPVPLGTDSPIISASPWRNMASAVKRRTLTGRVLGASQSLSLREAVEGYTMASAYTGFLEKETGSLFPGKAGDLVILEADPFSVPLGELPEMPVWMTVVNGEIAFSREG